MSPNKKIIIRGVCVENIDGNELPPDYQISDITINLSEDDSLIPDRENDVTLDITRELTRGLEAFNSLTGISTLSQEEMSSNAATALLQSHLRYAARSTGIESVSNLNQVSEELALKIVKAARFYHAFTVKYLEEMQESIPKFKEEISKLVKGLRYITYYDTKPRTETFSKEQVSFFSSNDSGFDIIEILSTYNNVISSVIHSTSLFHNLNILTELKIGHDTSPGIYEGDYSLPFTPVSSPMGKDNGMVYVKGPALAKGYRLVGITPAKFEATDNEYNAVEQINESVITIVKEDIKYKLKEQILCFDKESISVLIAKLKEFDLLLDESIIYSKSLVEKLNVIIKQFNDYVENGVRINDTLTMAKLSEHLAIINYSSRHTQHPFFELIKLASITYAVLISKFSAYIEQAKETELQ